VLSKEDNEFTCRIGLATPMGELFRRFWLPAMLPSDLPKPDCPPVRRKEHLGTSDLAIITARKRLLNLAGELQQGIEPFPASHGNIYRVRAMDVNTPVDNFDAVIASHGSGLLAKM
jgi:hypothetical protein